jgi:phosphate transport system protein
MTRFTLDRQLQNLRDEILLLSNMVEQATLNAVNALKRRDVKTAREIYENDYLINEKRYAIENAILILIATQQPMARDLRFLAAVLEVNSELERMGDYAKGIAKVVVRLNDNPIPLPIEDIQEMANIGTNMLSKAIGAFVSEDEKLARAIPDQDDTVDSLYEKVYRFIVNAMIENPEIIDSANLIFWVAHNLERMADRVTNICERTIFIKTGELLETDVSELENFHDMY